MQFEARRQAESFLNALDSGNVSLAYGMLKPELRERYDIAQLGKTGALRRSRVASKRSFVKFGLPASGMTTAAKSNRFAQINRSNFSAETIVCYFEPPVNNFGTASYTLVTVSGRLGELWVTNFQTTSEPAIACR